MEQNKMLTFLFWFVLAYCFRASVTMFIIALEVALKQTDGYKKEEILNAFNLPEDFFQEERLQRE